MVDSRMSRPELFMQTAHLFAQRSTCKRGQVGCVVVHDRRIVATGYNGAPPGMPHCTDLSGGCDSLTLYEYRLCPRCDGDGDTSSGETCQICAGTGKIEEEHELGCQRAVHAEANAIAFAARHGVSLEGAEIFCTHGPCLACARLIVSAGIARVTYNVPYRLDDGLKLLGQANIPTYHFKHEYDLFSE